MAAVLVALSAEPISAQNSSARHGAAKIRQPPAAAAAKSFQITSELKQQQKFLRDVATRYEAVSVYDFIPLLSYTYVWNALREHRIALADPRRGLKPDQAELIREGYELLESDVVLRFLDHQLGMLDETLQLDEAQYEQIEKVLSADLAQKRALLATKGINSKLFLQRIHMISHESEKNVLTVLTEEQRTIFHKQIVLTRDRLVG
jgi:hypothetical protein